MRRKEKLHVEGRILAHPDAIELVQSSGLEFAETIMRTRAREFQPSMAPMGSAAAQGQLVDLHEIDFVPALLRFQHQDKGRVLVDVDFVDRVHDDADFQFTHVGYLVRDLIAEPPRCEPANHASRVFLAATKSTGKPSRRRRSPSRLCRSSARARAGT